VILCPDRATALDWAAAAPPQHGVHPVTGLGRAARLIAAGAVDVLAGSVADLGALVARAALKLEHAHTLVLAWPEALADGPEAEALATLLAASGDARRIILSWHPVALAAFLERHAFRAPIIGAVPLDDTARALPPIGPARYVLAEPDARLAVIRAALDVTDPKRAFVWTPSPEHAERLGSALGSGERGAGLAVGTEDSGERCDLVICARVPSREQFAALAARGPVVLLLTPAQLGYARAIAAPLSVLRLPGAAERAADRIEALRRQVVARLEAGDVDAELLALEPLFERFDAAEIAAALLALAREAGSGKRETAGTTNSQQPTAYTKLFINVGKKDHASPKDFVAALIKEAGVQKEDLGRIELRDTFTTVEVAAGVADAAAQKLSGVTIRGRRVQARPDRGK
jgi:ATP-dependent RNA helicase DeaD